ncbi:MAG: hypothetical protein NTX45_21780 [Proteobacteria bacterium]|nr:hypothetical protein [Pseudomonadota bacterium]
MLSLTESSHRDVNLRTDLYPESDTYAMTSYRPWHWIPASLLE